MAGESFEDFGRRLQARFCTAEHFEFADSPEKLHRRLRRFLCNASDDGWLTSSIADIHRCVRLLPNYRGQPAWVGISVCEVNFHRDPALPHIARSDGAWFDFGLILEQSGRGSRLLASHYEIRFPPGWGPRFLRLDLNLPEHANQDDGLRSHWHPASDDLLLPAPILAPLDALQLMVRGLRQPAARNPRMKGRVDGGTPRLTLADGTLDHILRRLLTELAQPFESVESSPRKALRPLYTTDPLFEDAHVALPDLVSACIHIADTYGAGRLSMPVGRPDRAEYLHWMLVAQHLLAPLVEPLWLARLDDPGAEASLGIRNALSEHLRRVGAALAGRDYLMGPLTAADILLGSVLDLAADLGLIPSDSPITGWLTRLRDRASW